MSTASGLAGESRAADFLESYGFKVLARNWRTKYCEIDIVAQKTKRIYLVEVKYRQSRAWGDGFDYITPKKLGQMKFAAEMWVHDNQWNGDYQLAVVALDDNDCELVEINS